MSQKYVFLLWLFCIFLVLFLISSESAQYGFRDTKKHFFDSFLTLEKKTTMTFNLSTFPDHFWSKTVKFRISVFKTFFYRQILKIRKIWVLDIYILLLNSRSAQIRFRTAFWPKIITFFCPDNFQRSQKQ